MMLIPPARWGNFIGFEGFDPLTHPHLGWNIEADDLFPHLPGEGL